MMDSKSFRKHAHEFVDWMADYLESNEDLPVKSQVQPGDIYNQIPDSPPEYPESMEQIFQDFNQVIIPGMTHWQSPNFFAYFPANSSYPSLLAEMLTATLGAQCMVWDTSPAAAELEEAVLNWLKKMLGIPEHFFGVIQDTASTATLAAILTAREKLSDFSINEQGFSNSLFRVYCSAETHSSVEKAVKIAGLGKDNLVQVPVDEFFRMDTRALESAIRQDLENGKKPVCVIATLGTTGSTAIDPLDKISIITEKYNCWLHVDAAYAGTALLLDEYKWMISGIEKVDSFVFNPHKWMFTNFDCSVYYVKDKEALIKTFAITPEYLKTKADFQVNNYRDWGIPLGRRFRALKLWFVIRSYGINGLKHTLGRHIQLAQQFESWVLESDDFEMVTDRTINLVCFRYHPEGKQEQEQLNKINEQLLHDVNSTGQVYLSHTKLNGVYTLRMVIGQTRVSEKHVQKAWALIRETAGKIS